MKILFVCTGNTCRSPLAEVMFRRVLAERGVQGIEVSSAGIASQPGSPASEGAKIVLEGSEDLSSHRSRQVDRDILGAADLILTMTSDHKKILQAQYPGFSVKIHTVGEYVWGEERNIDDPFGGDRAKYMVARKDIGAAVTELASKLTAGQQKGGTRLKIAIACDHGGYRRKEEVKAFVESLGHEPLDLGCNSESPVDYPDFAALAAKAVISGQCELGIIVCGTGLGMAIAANKIKGIRAVNCHDCYSAAMARAHNDANILTLGGRVVGGELALALVKVFLETPFEGGRHLGRLKKIADLEEDFG